MSVLALVAAVVLAAEPAAVVLAAEPPAVEDLGWMAGTWEGEAGGVRMEETWTAPRGGTLLGLHRDVKGERTVSFEFLRIAVHDGAVTYWASPQGRPPTAFRLVEAGGKRAVFTNPQHDFPQRITYWIGDGGALHARIDALDGSGAQEWTWTRRR